MSLTDFDEDLRKTDESNKQRAFDNHIQNLRDSGSSDYAIEREKEVMLLKPVKLEKFESSEVKYIHEVKFFFKEDDFELFNKYFTTLEYKGNNSTQNWLLLGFLKLVEQGKIQISDKAKEVWVI